MDLALAQAGEHDPKPPKKLPDFGLMLGEEGALSAFSAYVRSKYNVLGSAGGWMDQTEAWKHDMEVLMHEYGVAQAEVARKKGRRGRKRRQPAIDFGDLE